MFSLRNSRQRSQLPACIVTIATGYWPTGMEKAIEGLAFAAAALAVITRVSGLKRKIIAATPLTLTVWPAAAWGGRNNPAEQRFT